jgi:hypothetical protein
MSKVVVCKAMAAAGTVAALIFLSSCAGTDSSGDTASVYADRRGLEDVMATLSLNYEALSSNALVAKDFDVVIVGQVRDIKGGPEFGRFDDEFSDIPTVVVEVTASKIVQGDADESVYFALWSAPTTGVDEWLKALPAGTDVVLYADVLPNPQRSTGSGEIDSQGWTEGRPADEPLYVPHVQGFAVMTEVGELYWPLTGVTSADELSSALPDGSALGTDQFDR